MGNAIDKQIEDAEKALASATDDIVKQALRAQIDAIKKKQKSNAARVAVLHDGSVRVGDTVYYYEMLEHNKRYVDGRYQINLGEYMKGTGVIVGRTITHISPKGDKIGFKHLYGDIRWETLPSPNSKNIKYYAQQKTCIEALVKQHRQRVQYQKNAIEHAKEALAMYEMELNHVSTNDIKIVQHNPNNG